MSDAPGTPLATMALRVEAVSVYERAYRLSSSKTHCDASNSCLSNDSTAFLRNDHFWDQRSELEQEIDRLLSTLTPMSADLEHWRGRPPKIDVQLLTVHALANAACVYLQRDLVGKLIPACEKCFKAAHSVSLQARQLKQEDYELLDPVISVCTQDRIFALLMFNIVTTDVLELGGEAFHTPDRCEQQRRRAHSANAQCGSRT